MTLRIRPPSGTIYFWAMEQYENELVSFTSFVQKFKLSDLQDAQDAYEALIDSTWLKTLRRQFLNTTYNTFKKHRLRRFWPNYLLKMERRETKTNFDITAAKTARIVQDASLKETSRAAGLLEDNSNGQDKLEHSVRPKRKMQQDSFAYFSKLLVVPVSYCRLKTNAGCLIVWIQVGRPRKAESKRGL